MNRIVFLDANEPANDVATFGGKGAGLQFLLKSGIRVPQAFVVTAEGYRAAVPTELRSEVANQITALPTDLGTQQLEQETSEIRNRIVEATAGHPLTSELRASCERLQEMTGQSHLSVAVRSSSVTEDSNEKSFAGEHDTYLWVTDCDQVDYQLRQCWASLVTARAVSYQARESTQGRDLTMAVIVQQMVPARAAGVFMTLNPSNGDRSKILVESVWGLGEPLVSGQVTPDRFLIDKITGDVLKRELADKATACVRDPATGHGVTQIDVASEQRHIPSLTDAEITEITRLGCLAEHSAGEPQDGEFALSDADFPDNTYLLQCRPETVWSRQYPSAIAKGATALDSVVATLTNGF